jgi:hypothetical protein
MGKQKIEDELNQAEEKLKQLKEQKKKIEEPEIIETKESKSFWSKIFKKEKVKKPESVAILYLRNNRNAEAMYLIPKDGMFDINGKKYHQRKDCIYSITKDKIPLAIIPEDGLIPIGTSEYNTLPIETKLSELQNHAINAIRNAELVKMEGGESKMNMKMVIIIVIVAIVGFALLKNYI